MTDWHDYESWVESKKSAAIWPTITVKDGYAPNDHDPLDNTCCGCGHTQVLLPDDTYYLIAIHRVTDIEDWPCLTCKGSGMVPEEHGYATEYLGCPDCRAEGKVRGRLIVEGSDDRL